MDNSANVVRIGLVDDDPSVRRAISRLLRSRGYECVTYESAESALADPELLWLNCAVLDLELPGINGFELRNHLRDLVPPIPYLFVTAHAESDFLDWDAQMGDSLYLRKPVEEDQLLSSIEKLICRAA